MGDKGISGHGVECACMPMTSKSEIFKKDLSGTVHLCKTQRTQLQQEVLSVCQRLAGGVEGIFSYDTWHAGVAESSYSQEHHIQASHISRLLLGRLGPPHT